MTVVIYARYSSENQSEESITAQIRACTEYCVRNGHDVVNHYIDRAMTARCDKRPAFQQMIADAKNHQFQAVVVHKLDRFSRDRLDHAIYRQELRKSGVRLISVLENLDDSPESVVLESVLEGFSEYYSKNLARETRKGLKEIALQAKRTSGSVLYGYSVDEEGHYIINEAEAAVVRRIFDANLKGTGYDKLLAELRREGVKTHRGNDFSKNTFIYMLRNRRYTGDYIYSPIGELKYHKCEPIIIENAIPAIISKADWFAVQEKIRHRKNTGRPAIKKTYLLSGILYCGKCEEQLYGHAQRQKRGYEYYSYECRTHVRDKSACSQKSVNMDRIETAVCDYIRKLFAPVRIRELKEYFLEHMEQINQNSAAEIKAYELEKAKLKIKSEKAIDLLLEGDLPKEAVKRKLEECENRIAILESKIAQLQAKQITPERIENALRTCLDFDDLTREEQRHIIKKIIKKITVSDQGDGEKSVIIISSLFNYYENVGGATLKNATLGDIPLFSVSGQMKMPQR